MNVHSLSAILMQAIAQNCNQLQSLNLGWCEDITDKGVTSLASGCPDLRALDLCGCVLITGIQSHSLEKMVLIDSCDIFLICGLVYKFYSLLIMMCTPFRSFVHYLLSS